MKFYRQLPSWTKEGCFYPQTSVFSTYLSVRRKACQQIVTPNPCWSAIGSIALHSLQMPLPGCSPPEAACGMTSHPLKACSSQSRHNCGGLLKLCRAQLWPPGFPKDCRPLVDEALQAAAVMDQEGLPTTRDDFFHLFHECGKSKKELWAGHSVHYLLVSIGLDAIAWLVDPLIRLFASCSCLQEASAVFYKVSQPTIFTWNAIICAHLKVGEGMEALILYHNMQVTGVAPDKVSFLYVLKACSIMQALELGKIIHLQMIDVGLMRDDAIGNTLLDVYAKCGSLEDACNVFENLSSQEAVSWSVMISGYVLSNCFHPALELFWRMCEQGILPNRRVFQCVLKACANCGAIGQGRLIHDQIRKLQLTSDACVGAALVSMYGTLGYIKEARQAFDEVPNKKVQPWSELIVGYTQHGHFDSIVQLYQVMQREGIELEMVATLQILKACCSIGAIGQGRLLHDQILKSKLEGDSMIGNTLIDLYAKCGSLKEAHTVFDILRSRDVVSWSVLIGGYVQHGDGYMALRLFEEMQQMGLKASKVSFLGSLRACGSVQELHHGRLIHGEIINTGFITDLLIGSTLVDMYAKCGSLREARAVFDRLPSRNIVTWSAMVSGYVQHGHGSAALHLFCKMLKEDIDPDAMLFTSLLKACASIGALDQGRLIHEWTRQNGFESHISVGNAVIDVYSKCRCIEDARWVFDTLPSHDVISWSTMIAAYVQHGYDLSAFQLLENMLEDLIEPNRVTLLGLLKACGNLGAIKQGMLIHSEIIRHDFDFDLILSNAVLDMYCKSGNLYEARALFDRMQSRDEVTWSAIIAGYAWHGYCPLAKQCLQSMHKQGLRPDKITFTNVLTACSHAGLPEEGYWFFRCMMKDFGIKPSIEQYSCLIDLLSRTGRFGEADDLLRTMPILPDLITWTTLLTSCKIHGNNELGRHCFDQVVQLDPDDASGYVLMSCMDADVNSWLDVETMQVLKRSAGAQKTCAYSWIEANNRIHKFLVGEDDYPDCDYIDAVSGPLRMVAREQGRSSSGLDEYATF